MKDLRLPAAVTIPAAIGLVGVFWLLRRKAGSGDGKKSTDKGVQEENEGAAKSDNFSGFCDEQIENRQTVEGIGPQGKLSESLICDSGTCSLQLESLCSPELSVGQVALGLGKKPDVESYRHFNEPHQWDGPVAEIEQHGQVENVVVSDSVCQNWQVNNFVPTGLIQPEQFDSMAVSSITGCDLAVSSITGCDLAMAVSDAQTTLSDGVKIMGVETCVEGKGLPSVVVDKNSQSYDITEHGQGDGLLPESKIHGKEFDGGLVSSDIAQEGQHGGLVLSDAAEEDQCGTLTSQVIKNDGSSCVLFGTTPDVQQCYQSSPSVAAVFQQEVGFDKQHDFHKCDQSSHSTVSEAEQDDGLDEEHDVHKQDQSSHSVAAVFQQEVGFDKQHDFHKHDQSSHSTVSEAKQDDGLEEQRGVQGHNQSSTSVASEVQQVDGLDEQRGVQQLDQSSLSVASEIQQVDGLDEQRGVQQLDQSSLSVASEVQQVDGLYEQRGVHQHDQSSPSVASDVRQASDVSPETDLDHQIDVQGHDQSSPLIALEVQQVDGLDNHWDFQQQDQMSPSVASELQKASGVSQEEDMDHQLDVQSSPSVVSDDLQEDDLVASDAHYDSLISSGGQQDSQYESLWSSYGQLESNCESLMSLIVQQDDQCDSMMSSDNTQDSEFGSQISLDAAMPIGLSNAIIAEFDQGDCLTTLQKAYIEQQVMTAMGDGLEEACRLLHKSPAQSESSVKQMSVKAAILDDASRSGSADVSGETGRRVEKCGGSDGKSILILDEMQEDDQDSTGPTCDLQSEETAGVQSYAEINEDLVCLEIEATVPESSASHNTESLGLASAERLESPCNELFISTANVCLESAKAESLGLATTESSEQVTTESLEQVTAESLEQVITESLEQVTTESLEQVITESLEQVTTESLEQVITESLEQVTTESLEQVTTESESSELAKTESLEPATTESLKPANTESLDSASIASLDSVKTKYLEPAMTESLESFNTAAVTESLESANTAAETESLESASTESLVSASTESLEPTSLGPLQSSNTESLTSADREFLASAGTETLELAVSDRDFENVNPAVIQERIQLVQETLITVKPGSNSSLSRGSLPHVPTAGEDLLQDNPVRDVKQSEQYNKDLSKDNSSSTASNNDAHTKDVSVKTVHSKSASSDTSIQNLPSEKMEARKAFSWLPKASSSSVDSFGPEEIEALWGIESSMMNLDAELTFLDTEPVAVHVDGKGVAKGDLGAQLEVPARVSLGGKDNVAEAASSGSVSDTSCAVSDPNVKDGALGKSISPVCDNNSEGSNDSGRGGSEHDMVCQGGDVPVHFNFCMPSDLCGQFIGKHGKNINYLKSRSGAHVTLTSNAFTPEYQICQIVGTQAEVDDALSMIRRKFPLQDYPHLTMDPVDMSMPLPLVPDGQVVYPEVMQLNLPEGVSVDVFVSAVVDAGQVFVQQPTHRSYMSLEKMNYFLNLVYSQDPNVPSVPLPIESGVICVCESEGYWYRAMIMSPVDENGEVQLKFVDYGGYITLPVASLKQIRVDFMNLPFQAVECFMANITPNQGEKLFSDEATQALCDLTQGKLLQCQVVARTEYGIPYIHLYQVNTERNSAVLINRALVNRRLVRWIEIL